MSCSNLTDQYNKVRRDTIDFCKPLETEDYLIQPMDDASPPKWHLAHVTWFFETFLLKPNLKNYRPFNESFEVLFNSYYNGIGEQFPRSKRGHLSRPTVAETLVYRDYVDEHMNKLLRQDLPDEILFAVSLGIHHEQQHQELLFTDIKYNLGHNPLHPAYQRVPTYEQVDLTKRIPDIAYRAFKGGIYEMGANRPTADKFVYDNESPIHEVLLRDFQIADRLVTNREYLNFIESDGYEQPALWLSDAWTSIAAQKPHPLYWRQINGDWFEYTLNGLVPLRLDAPVCHVSGYETDAYARWLGQRLPTEAEWEIAARDLSLVGNFVDTGKLHPQTLTDTQTSHQMYGDAWEWTSSGYSPYPGFEEFPGKLGEYNGKFMANQLVLRGGSCVTSADHIRLTYRNFFYPKDRWQFTGIRLAQDC